MPIPPEDLQSIARILAAGCYIAIGSTPTATNTSMYLPANMPEYFVTNRTDNIAVLEVTAPHGFGRSGTLPLRLKRRPSAWRS